MTDYPMNLKEWRVYVWALSLDEVFLQANAINSMSFIHTLREDGFSPDEIEGVYRLFGERLLELGVQLPSRPTNGYLSYVDLMA